MRAVVQRVSSAVVQTDGAEVARIDEGMFVLLGVARGDTREVAERLARKVVGLRIFDDSEGRLSEALGDREILCVSQFTLLGDATGGNRPGFGRAAPGSEAEPLYELFCDAASAHRGVFGEQMRIEVALDGPVTIEIEF